MMSLNPHSTNLDLYPYFKGQKKRDLMHPGWLARAIAPVCHSPRRGYNGQLKVCQDPMEFAQFLVLLAKFETKTYLEIGVLAGGSLFLADSYLRAVVPDFIGSTGVDPSPAVVDLEIYQEQFPSVEVLRMPSSDLKLKNRFLDAAFIDGSHKKSSVINDFYIVAQHCRLVGFHDICAKGRAVWRAWEIINRAHYTKQTWEFINLTRRLRVMMGIGVINMRSTVLHLGEA